MLRALRALRAQQLRRHFAPERGFNMQSPGASHAEASAATAAPASGITAWASADGHFRRQASQFRERISGAAGARFAAESGRYHLYVSYACPWAHRTLIVRALKGLQEHIGVTVVHWHMGERGWRFVTVDERGTGGAAWARDVGGDRAGLAPDPLEGHGHYTHLRDLYLGVQPQYAGRFTVPVLYDKRLQTIVSNESADIIRMFYREFDGLLAPPHQAWDLLPADLLPQIDAANEWIYPMINNGVYRSGFATTQDAYEMAVKDVFDGLDRAEKTLKHSGGPFWFGPRLTEVDIRLYTTIIRFDPVYVQHFKTNLRDIRSGYPALHRWMRHLFWHVPAFRDTTDFVHIKRHYTRSHSQINPLAITPVGPVPDVLPEDEEVRAVEAAKR